MLNGISKSRYSSRFYEVKEPFCVFALYAKARI